MLVNFNSISKLLQTNTTFFVVLLVFLTGCTDEEQKAKSPLPTSPSSLITRPVPSPAKSQTSKNPRLKIVDQSSIPKVAQQLATGKQVIARDGGITYPSWANANDDVDYNTTTNYPQMGRWGNETNNGNGTFQIIDLGSVYQLNGVGYKLDWDGAFKNSLTFQVEVSTDNKSWQLVSKIIHPYSESGGSNKIDINVAIKPIAARYVKYWEPPDGRWNGWGTFFQLRAYSLKTN
ncbi:discoidin domain-containing protein [Nostoc sp. HG1]|nr:discoidin domain-containing protein [Nostoc sp. HG1]